MPSIAVYARKSTESEDRQILSIDSQVKELKDHAVREGLAVAHVFTESKSAKAPGRPVFNELFGMVQAGRIDGVLCWKLDRLARNPVDGGAVIWAMEERKLATIYTPQRTFANTSNDKFWMQLEFGMAKKYVDDLSDNVKRGLRAKLSAGWATGLPPIGYLNDQVNHTIVKDPERFGIVRRMWDLMLSGSHTPPRILLVATERWGLRTRLTKHAGGKPLALSSLYKLFRNPFYCGMLVHDGEYFQGHQPPMVLKSEFDRVQEILSQTSSPRPKTLMFAYTGMIKCGECGASVTAEKKVNRHGRLYEYYHCTKRRPRVKCSQPVITTGALEGQILAFLDRITIPAALCDWATRMVREAEAEERAHDDAAIETLRKRLAGSTRGLASLIDIRLRGLITDDEYIAKKKELERERSTFEESLSDVGKLRKSAVQRTDEIFQFASTARYAFVQGDNNARRQILRQVGSNLILKDKTLVIQPTKPLELVERTLSPNPGKNTTFEPSKRREHKPKIGYGEAELSTWRGLVHDVRTYFIQHRGVSSFSQRFNDAHNGALNAALRPSLANERRALSPDTYGLRKRISERTAPSPSGPGSGANSRSDWRVPAGSGGVPAGSGTGGVCS